MTRLKPAIRRKVVNRIESPSTTERPFLGNLDTKDQTIILCLVVIIAILACLILYRISTLGDESIIEEAKIMNWFKR